MEDIDKVIDILQAFRDNKTIELSYDNGKNWTVFSKGDIFHFGDGILYRVKKEPTYRPYANVKEFLKASKEHGPYIQKSDTKKYYIVSPVSNEQLSIDSGESYFPYLGLLINYTWADETPCGILEQ